MKKLIMASVLATTSIFTMTAYTSAGATTATPASPQIQNQHKKGMKYKLSQLDLNESQQSQIQSIRQNSKLDRALKREAVMNVLTADQKAQLENIESKRGSKHQRDGHKKGKHNPLAKLNLSANQKAQVEAIRKDTNSDRMQKRKAVMSVLTADQRQKLKAFKSKR